MRKHFTLALLLLLSTSPVWAKSLRQAESVKHAHGDLIHQHLLPAVGMGHKHNGNNKEIGVFYDELVHNPFIYKPPPPLPPVVVKPVTPIRKYGKAYLHDPEHDIWKTSFHFSMGNNGNLADGDFYYSEGKFWANNRGQQGLVDLGKSVPFDPNRLNISRIKFYKQGVKAKHGHVYLSRARRGEDNRYILFRVINSAQKNKMIGVEYTVFETGSIVVQSNKQSSFSIRGPRRFSSEGKRRWEKDKVITGNYTIIFNYISGYQIPPSQTKRLERGGTIVFTGEYRPNRN